MMMTKDALIKQYNLYTEEDVDNIKLEHQKQIKLVKKAAEVQMRNIKMLAKDKARLMLEKTVARINSQFQQEILSILVDYQVLKEHLGKQERENKELKKRLIEVEYEIAQRN